MKGVIQFVVPGTPVSFQSRGLALRTWKETVTSIAREAVLLPTYYADFAITITHFYVTPPRCDADNMSKPICDALNNVVYADDRQIVERTARQVPLYRSFAVGGMPRELAIALSEGSEFVFIRLEKVHAETLPIFAQDRLLAWA
jgi:Endodeoxyribonuclease RusA